jgi:gliding motility-associated-like protein
MKKIFLLACVLLNLSCFAQVPAYAPSSGIVAFWPFSGNANDVSGNGNNGTVNGATLTTDRFGAGSSAYYFSNTAAPNAYIQANVNTASINTSGAMTLSFWVYRVGNGYSGARLMEFGSCATCAGQILVGWGNGLTTMTFRHYLTATDFTTYNFSGLADNTWYNIVYTNDGTTAKYYLNGVLVNSVASPDPAQLLGNVAFGRMNHPANDAFNGNLDDIGIWNRALTPCEISNLYIGNTAASFSINPFSDTTYMCDSIQLDAGSGYSSYAWSNNETTQTITAKSQGLYKVAVTNSSGCTASDSTTIIVLKPTITPNDTSICLGSSITLNATGVAPSRVGVDSFFMNISSIYSHTVNTTVGANYIMTVDSVWSIHLCPGNGDLINQADAAFYYQRSPITQVPAGSDLVHWNGVAIYPDGNTYNSTHHYTYTLPPATQSTEIFSFIDPSGPSSYGDNCGGMHFRIYRVNNTNATYTWSAKPATTAGLNPADVNNQSPTVKPTATTMYYVTVNDGVASCEDSVLISVAVLDTSINSSDPLMVCASGGNVHLHAGIAANYKWLQNGTPIPGATSKDYTATQTGAYRVVVYNAVGCSDTSRTLTINAYPQPIPGFTITTATTQCLSSNSFSFTNTSAISAGTLSYKWLFGDGNTATSTNATYSYAAANSYNVQLIDSSNNGCMDTTTSQLVVVKPASATPIVTPGGPLTFCGGSINTVLTSNAVSGNQWYNNGTLIPGETNQTYTATAIGVYNVVNSANGCASDSSNDVTINLYPQPVAGFTISNSATQCLSGNNFSFTNTSTISSGTISYKWLFGDGNTAASINATHTYATANSYNVQLIDSSNNGCMDTTASQIVLVKPATATPVVSPAGPLAFCGNVNAVLTSNAATGNQWYNNGTLIPGETNQTYNAIAAGSYNVISNINTCASDSSNDVTTILNPVPPTPAITAGGSLTICGSGTVVLTSSATSGNAWYLNGAPVAGATNQNYAASAAGNYHVIATVSNCPSIASDDTTVTIVPLPPKPTIVSTGTDTLCPGGTVLLTSSEAFSNQWYKNIVPIPGAVNNTYTASEAGSYTVEVSNVCAGDISDPTVVIIKPSPAGIRYSPINVQVGTAFPLQARNIGDQYLWTPSTGLNADNIADPVTDNYTQTQDYLIQIIKTNANCITYDTLLVKAFGVKGLLVPTAFSPNNDGRNDKLTITLINIQHLNYFKIYNRWGQVVFQTANSNIGWDGNYQGVPQGVGNYIWAAEGIDENGKTVDDHGSVMIIR